MGEYINMNVRLIKDSEDRIEDKNTCKACNKARGLASEKIKGLPSWGIGERGIIILKSKNKMRLELLGCKKHIKEFLKQ